MKTVCYYVKIESLYKIYERYLSAINQYLNTQKLKNCLASFSSLKSYYLINLILSVSIAYLCFCNFVFKSHIELANGVTSSFEKCLENYPNFTFCLWFIHWALCVLLMILWFRVFFVCRLPGPFCRYITILPE